MRRKSSLVITAMLLVLVAPVIAQSAEAVIEDEGTLRGRGFIYLPANYPYDIGYVDVSIRVQSMRHTGILRMKGSLEYTVFTENYDNPIRALRNMNVTSFRVWDLPSGHEVTLSGTATFHNETATQDLVDFWAVFTDADGDGYAEEFTFTYLEYIDEPNGYGPVQGRITLRP